MLFLMTICVFLLQTLADDAYYGELNNKTRGQSVFRTGEVSEDITTDGSPSGIYTALEDTTIINNNETNPNSTFDAAKDNVPTTTPEKISQNDFIEMDADNSAALDVPALMNLIMNLTSDIETNLTHRLNESLQSMSLPTCGTPGTIPTTTSEYDANYTGSIVAKCFVCGLEVRGVPAHAHCADAFAGDFLPLVPVDPTAKSKISRYRKYCKYQNIPGFAYNSSDPRSIFGRWTGGCAVRWVDLSGIYTQRTCRSRLAPSVGQHYGSKRMAKLERALWMVDNGCIVSPMASLVPLSRGVSLYARFHACVCTGSWCNVAPNVGPHLMKLASALIAYFTSLAAPRWRALAHLLACARIGGLPRHPRPTHLLYTGINTDERQASQLETWLNEVHKNDLIRLSKSLTSSVLLFACCVEKQIYVSDLSSS